MNDSLNQIGKKIRRARLKRCLSQGDLAKLLKVDKAYISRIENGQNNLTVKSLVRLANALTTNIKKLF